MKDKIIHWIARRLPKRLIYWCTIRAISYATTGKYGNTEAPAICAMEVLKRWNKGIKEYE